MIRAIIFALLLGTAAQAFGQGCTSTATIPPPTIAPFSGFVGAGTYAANPEPLNYLATGCFGPNNPILRATDGNTALNACTAQGGSCTGKVNRSMYAANSDGSDNHMTVNDEQFWAVDSGNSAYIFDFHGMTFAPTVRYVNFPNCVLKFCGDPTASYTRSKTFLGFANTAGTAAGTVLSYYDTSTAWPTLPTRTTIIDFAASVNGIPASAVNLTDPVTCNHAETKCGTGFSTTTGQGSSGACYVAAYTIGSGMSVWNVCTATVTGDYGSTGSALCQNCAGGPINPGTFTIHNVKWSQDLTWAIVQTTASTCVGCLNQSDPYFWKVGTTNIYTSCGASTHCSGHFVSNGQLNFINEYATPNWIAKPFGTTTGTIFPTGTTCTSEHDQHASWLNDNTTDTQPFFVSNTQGSSGNPIYNTCDVAEIDALDPPTIGDNKVFRYAHNYGANVTEFAGQEQIAWVSADGKYVAMTSPMANSSTFIGQLGGTDGTYPALTTAISRSDIFVLQLSGGALLAPSPFFGFTETSTSPANFPTINYSMQRIWDSPPLQWPSINTSAGVFNYTNLDTMLAQDFTNSVKEVMYTLARTPPWATSKPNDKTTCHYGTGSVGGGNGECFPPKDLNSNGSGTNATWKAWITSIATHANSATYLQTHAHIRYWEIWNEPDAAFYWSGSFAQLSRLTEDARCIILGSQGGKNVIHQSGNGTATPCTATPIDPTALIIMSSGHASSPAVITYAQNQLYCNNTSGIPAFQLPCPNPLNATAAAIDVVNIHMKPGNATGNNCPAPTPCTIETGLTAYVSNIHGILQPTELAKPFWDGESAYAETGFATPYDNVDNASSVAARLDLALLSQGISGQAFYTWDSIKAKGAQVIASFQQAYNWLQGSVLTTPEQLSGGIYSATITKSGVPYLILWNPTKLCVPACPTSNVVVANQWTFYQDMTAASTPTAIVAHTVPVGIKPIILSSTIVITNPSCATQPCPLTPGVQNQAYTFPLTAAGGTLPYTWTLLVGGLPTGITMDSATGLISGTPTGNGITNFTPRVCDAVANCATVAVFMNVVGVVGVTTPNCATPPCALPNGTQGSPYSTQLGATGGTAPYTWNVSVGSLPTGLSLTSVGCPVDTNCRITGTPTVAGTTSFTVRACDTLSVCGTLAVTLTVIANPVLITNPVCGTPPCVLTSGTQNVAYTFQFNASGGVPAYAWNVSVGTLPVGITLNAATGRISGTPTAAGTSNFTIQVCDTLSTCASLAVSLVIATPPIVVITFPTCAVAPCALPNGNQGQSYTTTLTAGSGTAPYTWSITAGALPPGISLNASIGVVSGTPPNSGVTPFTIHVCDSLSSCASLAVTLNVIAAPIVITTPTCAVQPCALTSATQGAAYSFTFIGSGGTPPLTWSVVAGTLPAGLSLNSVGCGSNVNCHITGTPTPSGAFPFTIRACDTLNACLNLNVSLTVIASPVVITAPTCAVQSCLLPGAAQSQSYTFTFTASGGTSPYTWNVFAGSVPAGLTLSSGGVLSGTPTGSGTTAFTVQACDSLSSCTTVQVSLTITASAVLITNPVTCGTLPCPLTSGTQGSAYTFLLAAVGGTGPYTFNISVGSLPTGLSLSSTSCGSNTNCNIQGTPSGSGVTNFTVRACDTLASCTTLAVSLTVAALPVSITNPTCATQPCVLTSGQVGSAYTVFTFTATGGTAPFTWTVASGTLPTGLSLTGATISGTPTAVGTFIFSVKGCDTLANCATVSVSIAISATPVAITNPTCTVSPCSLPSGMQAVTYNFAPAATGGITPYTWTISVGSLPAGLTINSSTGAITGSPTGSGTTAFTIKVCDTLASCASVASVVVIVPPNPPAPATALFATVCKVVGLHSKGGV